MKKHPVIKSALFGLAAAIISFILLFSGVAFILDNNVTAQNAAAYTLLSLLLGTVVTVLHYFRMIPALIASLAGWAVGFFEMYRSFLKSSDGWGDLVGIISLFVWVLVGFVFAALVQILYFLIKKYKARRS